MTGEGQYSLNVRFVRYDGSFAILETEGKLEFRWPIKNLPENLMEGATVRLVLSTEQTEQAERELIAKTLINQLLESK